MKNQTNGIDGPFKLRRYQKAIFTAAFIGGIAYLALLSAISGLTLKRMDADAQALCGLHDVVCPGEVVEPIVPAAEAAAPVDEFEGEVHPISCYTGWESHGANGRNDGVSVATYLYPQGSRLWIEGIGERIVETVTNTKYADRVDVWLGDGPEDYERCLEFGVQMRRVRLISQ